MGAVARKVSALRSESEPKFQKESDWILGFGELVITKPAIEVSIEEIAIPVRRKPKPLFGASV